MESMQFDKYVALDILNRVHISIEHIFHFVLPAPTPISYIYPPTFYAVSDKFTIFVHLKTTKR